MTTTKLPLSGLTVFDLTLAHSGPTCVRHLADWGADVIRVHPSESMRSDLTDLRRGSDYQNLHRNKRAVVIDLKSPKGHAALLELVKSADVLVENMRVCQSAQQLADLGVAHRLLNRLGNDTIDGPAALESAATDEETTNNTVSRASSRV